mmetsp:Transcript_50907/g.80757  ORF Transcript_50907/g.80757 Transcript_50907/m.80757 type:complete len:366 (-) Transcript_50907:26-1123(-)
MHTPPMFATPPSSVHGMMLSSSLGGRSTTGSETPTPSTSSTLRSDAVTVDIAKLMEAIRQEVTTLMLDGVQKTASFCASQCAKHVVAARREMHQRLLDQRSEFERIQGVRLQGLSSGSCSATPGSTSFAMSSSRKSALPTMPNSRSSHTPRSATEGLPAFGSSPRITTHLTPRTHISGADEVACSAYDTYIGVHEAVQNLEDRTQLARTAMEAIEEAIKSSAVDVTSKPSSKPSTPGQSAKPSAAGVFSQWPSGRSEPNGGNSVVRLGGATTIPVASPAPLNTSLVSSENGSFKADTGRDALADLPSVQDVIAKSGGYSQRQQQQDSRHGIQQTDMSGKAKLRERSIASTASEAESLGPAALTGQ